MYNQNKFDNQKGKTVKKSEKKTEEIIEKQSPAPAVSAETEILLENEGKVGGILKQARLRQGKKLPDIAQSLCIRKAYLEAIEESRYDAIPEFPYGLGFIRSYADYLGEDSARIVRMYKDETDATFNGENKIYVLEPQVEATVPNKKYLLISLLAIIVVYFLWLTFNNYHNNSEMNNQEASVTETAADEAQFPLVVEDYAPVEEASSAAESETMLISESEAEPDVITAAPVEEVENNQVVVSEGNFPGVTAETSEAGSTAPTPVAKTAVVSLSDSVGAPTTAPAPGKSNIVLKIKKETWIEVKNNEKLYLSKVLQPGATYALPKAEGLILSVGRVDGVDIFVGDKQVDVVKPNKKTNIVLEDALKSVNH